MIEWWGGVNGDAELLLTTPTINNEHTFKILTLDDILWLKCTMIFANNTRKKHGAF
jgi:hypothetical protein